MKSLLLVLLVAFCSTTAVLADVSYLRVINAVQNSSGSIRVEGTGSIVLATLNFGQASEYILIPVGQQVTIQVFNSSTNALIAGPLTFNLAASNPVRWLSWVITQNASNALLVDNPSVPADQVFLRIVPLFAAQNLLINAQINGQSVVLVTNNLPALSIGSVNLYTYRAVPAGEATWTITSASPAISASVTFTLQAGKAYTFLLLPNAVLIVLDRSTTAGAAPATTAALTSAAVTTQPVTTVAVATTQPITTQAVTTQPVTTQVVTTQPVTTMAVTTQSITTQAVTTQSPPTGVFVPIIPVATVSVTTMATSTAARSSLVVALTHFILLALGAGYRLRLF